jgi:hypothetical protein
MKKYTLRETRKIIKDTFGDLEFNEEEHKYNVKNYVFKASTTKFVGNFYNGFDEGLMSYLCAKSWNKKNPDGPKRTVAWYKRQWHETRTTASTKGTRVHLYAEQYPNLAEPSCRQEKGVKEWWDSLSSTYQLVGLEVRVYSLELDQVGTVDILLRNRRTKKLVIADWKTNDKNMLQCYNKKKMKAPFSGWYDTSLAHYKLQLSNYQLVIETRTPLEVEDRWVIWLKEGDHNELDPGKSPMKYHIDEHDPKKVGEYFKQFNVKDYSKELHEWIAKQKRKK